MPEVTGILQALGARTMPLLLFVTASAEYALRRFNATAIDYLLKSFANDRFYAALDRARAWLQASVRGGEERREALPAFPRTARASAYSEVFAVRAGERYQIVCVREEIRRVETAGSYPGSEYCAEAPAVRARWWSSG